MTCVPTYTTNYSYLQISSVNYYLSSIEFGNYQSSGDTLSRTIHYGPSLYAQSGDAYYFNGRALSVEEATLAGLPDMFGALTPTVVVSSRYLCAKDSSNTPVSLVVGGPAGGTNAGYIQTSSISGSFDENLNDWVSYKINEVGNFTVIATFENGAWNVASGYTLYCNSDCSGDPETSTTTTQGPTSTTTTQGPTSTSTRTITTSTTTMQGPTSTTTTQGPTSTSTRTIGSSTTRTSLTSTTSKKCNASCNPTLSNVTILDGATTYYLKNVNITGFISTGDRVIVWTYQQKSGNSWINPTFFITYTYYESQGYGVWGNQNGSLPFYDYGNEPTLQTTATPTCVILNGVNYYVIAISSSDGGLLTATYGNLAAIVTYNNQTKCWVFTNSGSGISSDVSSSIICGSCEGQTTVTDAPTTLTTVTGTTTTANPTSTRTTTVQTTSKTTNTTRTSTRTSTTTACGVGCNVSFDFSSTVTYGGSIWKLNEIMLMPYAPYVKRFFYVKVDSNGNEISGTGIMCDLYPNGTKIWTYTIFPTSTNISADMIGQDPPSSSSVVNQICISYKGVKYSLYTGNAHYVNGTVVYGAEFVNAAGGSIYFNGCIWTLPNFGPGLPQDVSKDVACIPCDAETTTVCNYSVTIHVVTTENGVTSQTSTTTTLPTNKPFATSLTFSKSKYLSCIALGDADSTNVTSNVSDFVFAFSLPAGQPCDEIYDVIITLVVKDSTTTKTNTSTTQTTVTSTHTTGAGETSTTTKTNTSTTTCMDKSIVIFTGSGCVTMENASMSTSGNSQRSNAVIHFIME